MTDPQGRAQHRTLLRGRATSMGRPTRTGFLRQREELLGCDAERERTIVEKEKGKIFVA